MELAAAVVSRATGLRFASWLDEVLVQPLRLECTSLRGSAAKDGWSSTADLARLLTELLCPAGLLPQALLTQLRTVQYPGLAGVLPGFGRQDPNEWGLGFEIRGHKAPHWTGKCNSPDTYGHFGQSGTFFWIDPVRELGLVVLTDRDFGPWAAQLWPALADAVLAGAA
jgi:CubicO group peptidase (beta-lactamase class C family)